MTKNNIQRIKINPNTSNNHAHNMLSANNIRSQSGQVLLFVVVTMTIALAVAVGVSVRTISSLSRTSQTDTAARALSAAEAGAESFLAKTDTELQALLNTCNGNYGPGVPAACKVSITPNVGDTITSQAIITVKKYNVNFGTGSYMFRIGQNQLSEMFLTGLSGNINICWSNSDTSNTSVVPRLYFTVYDTKGNVNKFGVCGSTDCSNATGFINVTSNPRCYTYTLPTPASGASLKGLRMRALNAAADVSITPVGTTLVDQGYEITSVGELMTTGGLSAGNNPSLAKKTVVVQRSFSYLPGLFDFGIYSGDVLN